MGNKTIKFEDKDRYDPRIQLEVHCSCSNIFTVILDKVGDNKFECPRCGQSYNQRVVK